MSSPLSSDIPKPYGSTEKLTRDVNRAFALPVPAFGDLSKAANDVRIPRANAIAHPIIHRSRANTQASSSTRTSTTPPRVSNHRTIEKRE